MENYNDPGNGKPPIGPAPPPNPPDPDEGP